MSRADSIAERLSRKEIAFLVEQNPPPHHPPSRSVSAHAVDALVAPRIPTYRGPDSTPPRHSSATRDRSHTTVSEEQSGSRQRHSTSHHGRLRPGSGHPHAKEGEEQEGITPTHGSHRHVHRRRVYKGHRDSTDGDQPPSPSPRGYSRRRRSLHQHHASTSPSISAEASVSVVREMTATSSKVMVHPQTPHAYESSATSDSPVVAPTGSPPEEVMEPPYTLPLPSSTPSHSGAVPPCAAPFQEDARSSAVGAKEAPTAAAASAASVGDGAVVAATPSSATTHEASVPRRSPLVVEGSRAMYQTPIGSSTRVERGSPMTFSPSRSSGAFERLQAPSCVVSVFVALSGGATTSLGRLEEEEEEYEVMGVTLDATTMHEILLAVEAQLPLPRQPVIRASTSAVGEVQPRPVGSLRLLTSDNAHLRHVLRHGIPPIVVLREEHCLADVVDVRQLCSVCPSSELVRVFLRWVEPIRQRRLIASPSPSPMTTPRHRESSHLAPTPPTRAIMGAVEGEDDGHRHVTKQYADPTHGEMMLARQRLDMGEPGDHDAVGHPHERVPTNTHSVEELSEEVMAVDVDGVSSTSGSTACVSVVIETAPLPAGPPPTAPMLLPKIDAKETEEEEECTKHELPSSECGDVACVPELKREVEEEDEVDHQPSSADRRLSSTQISPSELDHHVASITPHDESSGTDSGPPVLVSCQREYMTPVAASAAPVAVGDGALSKLPPSEPFAPGWKEATEALTHFLRESMSTAHTTSTVDAVTGRPQHYITIESRVDEMRIKSIQVEVPVHHSYDNSPRSDA